MIFTVKRQCSPSAGQTFSVYSGTTVCKANNQNGLFMGLFKFLIHIDCMTNEQTGKTHGWKFPHNGIWAEACELILFNEQKYTNIFVYFRGYHSVASKWGISLIKKIYWGIVYILPHEECKCLKQNKERNMTALTPQKFMRRKSMRVRWQKCSNTGKLVLGCEHILEYELLYYHVV